jgi:hypothetical protein
MALSFSYFLLSSLKRAVFFKHESYTLTLMFAILSTPKQVKPALQDC